MLVSGIAVASSLAAASLLLSALVVRLVAGDRSTERTMLLIGAGTLIGTLVTSWFAQPPLSRALARIMRTR